MSLMRPFTVVKVEIDVEALFQHRPRGVVVQITILILDGAPESFDKLDVVSTFFIYLASSRMR